jgi:PAS domain S-box-containing protein
MDFLDWSGVMSSLDSASMGRKTSIPHEHVVQFYETDAYLCEALCRFFADGIKNNSPLLMIATPEHLRLVKQRLTEIFDVDAAVNAGRFLTFDARDVLNTFIEDELPNPVRFAVSVGGIIDRCLNGHANLPVFAYGEMVDVLWREGQFEAAIRLEELWNNLAEVYEFKLFCAYAMDGFYKETHSQHFEDICKNHSRVLPLEQQRTTTLEAELQHRKEIETVLLRALDEQRKHSGTLTRTEKNEAFLSSVVENADDAIVSKTLQGIVTSWNPAAEKLFGYTAEEMIGQSISILIPDKQADEEPRILERLRRGERIHHYETKRVKKNGDIVDISLTVSPIKDTRGRIIGASKIARDITERKRMEAERHELLIRERAARAEAEAASNLKDEFLATLSHELRTPLNAILGWIGILESRKDEQIVHRALEVIRRNATIQKRLIEDLLDVARILSGKMVIKTETVNLMTVLSAALDSVSPAAAAKAIQVEVSTFDNAQFITGDADRLQQVIWNLLSNAIKFTPRNGLVQVSLKRVDSHVEICVQDNGKGISPQFMPHIFERFRQADATTARHHGGLGLGLAVVRHVVEAHGGSVWADSPGEGRGSTFIVRLPIR